MHVPLTGTSGKTPRYLAIAAELAQAIESGQIAPGEKLPPHRVLAPLHRVVAGACCSSAFGSAPPYGPWLRETMKNFRIESCSGSRFSEDSRCIILHDVERSKAR